MDELEQKKKPKRKTPPRNKKVELPKSMEMAEEREQEFNVEVPADLAQLPLNTIDDYTAYNKEARRLKRPVRIPPAALHKQVKVKFQRFDQPQNVLKAYLSNAEIDWRGQLKSGKVYTLPLPVVKFLNSLAEPIFEEVMVNDGGDTLKETKQTGERNRFSCQVLDYV